MHDHFDSCEKRLEGLHARLKQDPDLLAKIKGYFHCSKEAGVIEEAPDSCETGECHYLPHHPVVKETKDTTNVRIVFNCLYDCLHKGPQWVSLLFSIFVRFRTILIVMTSDIEKAFLQISVGKGDRDYLRLVWFRRVFQSTHYCAQ